MIKELYDRLKETFSDFVFRTSGESEKKRQELARIEVELMSVYEQNDNLREANQDLETKARITGNEYQRVVTENDAMERSCLELESRIRELEEDRNPYTVSNLTMTLRHKNNDLKNLKRERARWKATARRTVHDRCAECNYERTAEKDPVLILNHAGFITRQTRASEKIYGNLIGKNIKKIISGSEGEVEKTYEHFNDSIEGWVYTTKKGKKIPTKVSVEPRYFTDESTGEKVRDTTIIRVTAMGNVRKTWDAIFSGEECYQDSLINDAEERKKREEEGARRVDEIFKERGLGGYAPGV